MKVAAVVTLKVLALTFVQFACFSVAAAVALGRRDSPPPADAAAGALALLVVCLLNTSVLTYIILRSRWSGWRLVGAVFVAFYGAATFMGQLESVVFLTRLPPGMVPRLFLMGALVAAPFAAVAVLVLGRWRPAAAETETRDRLAMPRSEWAWKLAVIGVAYVALYFTFGYYVAWRTPAVQEYYGGTDPGSFAAQMASVLRDNPFLVPFQFLRAMLWVAIALPVMQMMKGKWQETALALALLFSVVMNAQLLLPNEYMPEAVRMAHMAETASSNFIFGGLVGWLLAYRRPQTTTSPE